MSRFQVNDEVRHGDRDGYIAQVVQGEGEATRYTVVYSDDSGDVAFGLLGRVLDAGMSAHPMQRLIPNVPVSGDTPNQDPDYGRSYRVVEQVALLADEIQEEVWFDGIRTEAGGDVHLTAGGTPVARAAMSDNHADARLVILDAAEVGA